MPKKMEKALKKKAKEKGLTGDRADAYVYGTMQEKTNWKPKRKRGKKKSTPKVDYTME